MAGEIWNGVMKPFRVGIFWETESEAFPPGTGKEVLGNLVRGVLDFDKTLEVVLFVRPEDQEAAGPVIKLAGGRARWVYFWGRLEHPPSHETFLRTAGRRLVAVQETREIVDWWLGRVRSRISADIRKVLLNARSQFRKSPVVGLPLLVLGGCLAIGIILVYWMIFSARQLGLAVLRSLFFPTRFLFKVDAGRRLFDRLRLTLDPLILAKETGCDVWLIPSLTFPHSLERLKAATILMMPSGGSRIEDAQSKIAACRVAEASLCVTTASTLPKRHLESILQIDSAKMRTLPLIPVGESGRREEGEKGRKEAAEEWLKVFHEAVDIARWRQTFDRKLMEPWPRLALTPVSPSDPLKVFLFLPQVYYGGVLQASREIVSELASINAERRRLQLTLGLLDTQRNTQFVERLEGVSFRKMRLNPIRRSEVIAMCGGQPAWLADRPEQEFCFMSGAAQAAFEADAWFSLIDRFPLPLLPIRPLGILVQDVLQRVVPEIFDAAFFRSMAAGIIPTARAADVIVTGTPQTRDDVIAEYGIDPNRMRLIPVACNPHWHFSQTRPRAVGNVREPFILNVTNYSPHKGADVLLRAYAQLKRRLGDNTPQLVMCGFGTQGFSPAYTRDDGPLYWREIRQMVTDFGFEEGHDVVFLGVVSDEQLHYLYQHCRAVVNSARYDNGCLCLAEGAYFGRPAASSRYPAAEFHAQRFGYPGRFFPVGDAKALAESLAAAIQEPLATPDDIDRARSRFLDPEFSFRRYGERFYDLLIQLAEKGRLQKQTGELRISA